MAKNMSQKTTNNRVCSLVDCKKKYFANGYCESHRSKHDRLVKPLYPTWQNMIRRCVSEQHPVYKYYGGRGIKVCDRWLKSYDNFAEDMGEKPSKLHSLDRIDNDGDYTPENCRWASKKEQVNNRGLNSNSTSGVKGVSPYKKTGGWRASICVDYKSIHLGIFEDIKEAISARKKAEIKYGVGRAQ